MSEPGCDTGRLVRRNSLAEPHLVAEATFTTPHQRAAAVALIDHTNGEILTWLKLTRSAHSIVPISEQCPGSVHLTPSQIHALLALKECPNNTLLSLLELARNDLKTTAFVLGPSISPPPSSTFNSRCRQSAANKISRCSVDLTLSRLAESHYWCTVCENPNSYKDKGDWKKHEKGHETVFVCGSGNIVGDRQSGQSCSTNPFSCKRRDVMVNHLMKSHGINAVQQGRDLADQWRVSEKKQAWSCGFCVNVFLNFQHRLKHIDTEHFKKYENIQDWDHNKVIHGLLLQPRIENAWKKRTASLLPWMQPEDLVWTEVFAKHMRPKLELGPSDESDANRLAEEVWCAGKSKEFLNESAIGPSTVFATGIAGAGSLLLPPQDQTLTAQASGSAPEHRQRTRTMRATAYLHGDSLFGQTHGRAYADDSKVVASMASLDEGSQGTFSPQFFYPYQDWVAAAEGGIGCSSFDKAVTGADRGFYQSTNDWNWQ